jgi:hypothetical protein
MPTDRLDQVQTATAKDTNAEGIAADQNGCRRLSGK